MALTDVAVKKAKPTAKDYRKGDEKGLYLFVRPTGAKLWRFDYMRPDGSRNTMSFGSYPDLSLSEARVKRDEARQTLKDGRDPVQVARKERERKAEVAADTFGNLVADYIVHLKKLGRREATIAKNEWLLNDLASGLHSLPVREIGPTDILPILKRLEAQEKYESANRLRGTLGSVFRWAVPNLRADNDPTWALRGALVKVEETHHAAITDEKQFGALLRNVDEYDGWVTLRAALKISALCFPRPVELRKAEWSHFDLEKDVWTIPEELTKMKRVHDIPLSRQAKAIIVALKPVSGHSQFVFPSIRSPKKIISENGLNAALRRMGYTKDEHTAHGFRSSASTILNARKFDDRVIERSLAHLDPNRVRRAYNRYEFWDERVALAQAWADICDELKKPKRRNDDII